MYFFLAEQVFKIIGNFPTDYFWNKWNIFDMVLVMSSLLIDVGLAALWIVKSLKFLKSLKLIKIAKAQRAFRIFRSVRSFKFTKYIQKFIKNFSFISWIYQILQKAFLCLQSLYSILLLIMITVFMFSFLSCEIFYMSEEHVTHIEWDPVNGPTIMYYKSGAYGNFRSFKNSLYAIL